MSNITGGTAGGSFSSRNTSEDALNHQPEQNSHLHNSNPSSTMHSNGSNNSQQQPPPAKKKRNLPGTPDPSAEVVALSPNTLMATNRFMCEICHKGFQRDQNLQLHRRGHNLPWKLKQRTSTEILKRVYVCPETSCIHHNPARALGDLTGIKKHFCRKHGEKKWKCDKCSKKYAVQSDWKAHLKTCGTREYKCDCGVLFSRRDSFITHRAFCDVLAVETNKTNPVIQLESTLQGQEAVSDHISLTPVGANHNTPEGSLVFSHSVTRTSDLSSLSQMPTQPINMGGSGTMLVRSFSSGSSPSIQLSSNSLNDIGYQLVGSAHMSATALLHKAAQMGASGSSTVTGWNTEKGFASSMVPSSTDQQWVKTTMASSLQDQINGNVSLHSSVDRGNLIKHKNGTRNGSQAATTMDFLGVAGVFSHQNNFYSQQTKRQEYDTASIL